MSDVPRELALLGRPDGELTNVIAAIKRSGSDTRGLLAYLYRPGRHDEHLDPRLVTAYAMLGTPETRAATRAPLRRQNHRAALGRGTRTEGP
ncbi:hypothetical protein [Streptomyces sp. NPDC049970]|uniref:hypothetical protein n=1 Tax=Streptomyces sp. NPDC049970 TaxID=3155033 RepID=UPI00343F5C41